MPSSTHVSVVSSLVHPSPFPSPLIGHESSALSVKPTREWRYPAEGALNTHHPKQMPVSCPNELCFAQKCNTSLTCLTFGMTVA